MKTLFLILLIFLGGCASIYEQLRSKMQQRNETYSAKIAERWSGHPVDELVDKFGYPNRDFIAPNGNKVFVYEKSVKVYDNKTYQADYYGTIHESGGGETTYFCNTFFEVDSRKIILKVRCEGNACRDDFNRSTSSTEIKSENQKAGVELETKGMVEENRLQAQNIYKALQSAKRGDAISIKFFNGARVSGLFRTLQPETVEILRTKDNTIAKYRLGFIKTVKVVH